MEPITVLTAISAASASIKWLKERVGDCQDAAEVFGHVTRLMDCEKTINQDQSKQASVSDISLKSSIDHGIQKRLIREALQDAKLQIDLRFGPGTYQSFVDDHAKKLREVKEQERQARREARRKAQEIEDTIKGTLIVIVIILAVVALFAFLFVTVAQSQSEAIIL
tara:strand:- start:120 stop:617 length:498 start_codon:yes stop_codon:yes gene_type:complete